MRATTCSTPKVSRATRALMMLELSPLLTAANAPAESIPASSRGCRAKPRPVTWRPGEAGHRRPGDVAPEPAEGFGVLVDPRDAVPDLFQPPGDGGAHPAAAHHDHVHESSRKIRGAGRRPPALSPGAKLHPAAAADRLRRPASLRREGGAGQRRHGVSQRPYHRRVPTLSDLGQLPKRLVLGRPVRSDRAGESLLPKRLALPIFASDALSSVAYATQEILIVLTLGGVAYLYLAPWL